MRRTWLALPVLALLALWVILTSEGSGHHSRRPVAAPIPTPAPVAGGDPLPLAGLPRTEEVVFDSPALGQSRSYLVWLPAGYDRAARSGRRFPVLYLLHGAPANPQDLLGAGTAGTTLKALIDAHRAQPMLLVMPDGRRGGVDRSDSEWADTPAGRYASLVTDVVADVDRRFASIPSRLDRGIAGYSEGGYGAANLALHRPDLFSLFETWSGYFTQTRHGPFGTSSPAELAANSPSAELAGLPARLGGEPLSAWIYSGTADRDALDGETFAQNLAAAGAHVRAELYTGDHNWPLWRAHMADALLFASDAFGRSVRPPSELRLVSAAELAAARARYLVYLQGRRVSYCAEHGVASRPYCRSLSRPARTVISEGLRPIHRRHSTYARRRGPKDLRRR